MRRDAILLAAGFAIAYAIGGLFQHWHFASSYDLAAFDQAVWHLTRLEPPGSTITGHSNILGDHFYPIVAVFALPYVLVPRPETLIVSQAVLLGASVVPVWIYLRRRLERGPALGIAIAYGLFWGVQRTAWFDVHEMAFAPLLVASAILAMDRRHWAMLWISSALLMLTKEDLIPLVGGFGAYLAVMGEWRRGIALIAVSLSVFVLVVAVIIPWFSDTGAWNSGSAFQYVWRHPWAAPVLMVWPLIKLRTFVLWLAPFAFLPMLSPVVLIAIPVAAERLLSDVPGHWSAGAHYSAPLAPILAMAAGDGLARLAKWLANPVTRRRVVVATVAFSVVASAVIPGHQPLLRILAPKHYRPRADRDVAARALAAVPAGVAVEAQAAITPHLGRRQHLYVIGADRPALRMDVEYVIASRNLSPWPLPSSEDVDAALNEHRTRGYRAVFDEGGWIVLQRAPR